MPVATTADLHVAYDDHGPADAPVVVLLHGWPDSSSTWDRVAPALAASGRRVIVPTLRGFGETRFTSPDKPRTADGSILAMDQIALIDVLGIHRFAIAGHDWGSNIAETLAVGWPDRIERIALISSPPRLGGLPTPPFKQAQRFWYHWFMATERGADAVRADPRGFARLMWENWAPAGWFDEATFNEAAKAFDNPDWVDVTLHSYCARWGNAAPDPRGVELTSKVLATQTLSLPTLYIQGEADGVTSPHTQETVPQKFTGPFQFVWLPGVGHFPQREAPEKLAKLLVPFFSTTR